MVRIIVALLLAVQISASAQSFELKTREDKKKVEVYYNKKFISAYCWFDSTEKPVLFPIHTLTGNTITRGYPISSRAGERTDHPHHVGLWLNYESVNGPAFWNNSTPITAEKKPNYGSIRHQQIGSQKASKQDARLTTRSNWVDHQGTVLLEETTDFVFRVIDNNLVIDRTSTLKAVAPEVL